MSTYNTLHHNFLAAVKELGLKFPVKDISEKTEYGTSIVSEYLNSKKEVSEKFARKFCDAYDIDFDTLNQSISEPSVPYNSKKSFKDKLDSIAKFLFLKTDIKKIEEEEWEQLQDDMDELYKSAGLTYKRKKRKE